MTLTSWLILSIISLVLSALFSGTEIAFITADRVRVGLDNQRGGLVNRLVSRYFSREEFFISTILVGNNIVLVIYGMGAAALLEPWIEAHISHNQGVILLLQTLISTLVILFAGEFIPKSIFRINPNASLKVMAFPIYIFYILLYPIAAFTSWVSRLLMRLVGIKSEHNALGLFSMRDLNEYLETKIDTIENPKEALQVESEVKMFHNALDFSHTQLRDCMIPRNELVAVDIDDTSRRELSDLFTQTGRSKILVYKEEIDNVVGYLHVSELFDPSSDWREHIKEVLYAPETLLANTMMKRLLSEKRSMAVVVDEFGGTAGLVTLEDLVEEIFGDIQDEHDKNGLVAKEIAPGIYEFSGRTEVRELRDTYFLDIPEDDEYQTLAGYIMHNTGTIPAQGEQLSIEGLRFTILQRTPTRLELIKVERLPDEE